MVKNTQGDESMNFINNIKIRTKLLLSFVMLLLLTALIGVNSLYTANNIQNTMSEFIVKIFFLT